MSYVGLPHSRTLRTGVFRYSKWLLMVFYFCYRKLPESFYPLVGENFSNFGLCGVIKMVYRCLLGPGGLKACSEIAG